MPVAMIASERASRMDIATTHRSSLVDENVTSLAASSSSPWSMDRNATCTAQNRHAYCTSSGITSSTASLENSEMFCVRFKSSSTSSDSLEFRMSKHRSASRLSWECM